jgi:radical SAM protein with 4Fe4S-binding SPASM domain
MEFKVSENKAIKDYHYLRFLYEATHQKAFCSAYPLEIAIEVSSTCNARCVHCSSSRSKRKRTLMSMETFQRVIDEIKFFRPYVMYHLQAEPTVNKDLAQMIRIVHQAGLEDLLVTNGILLTKDKAKAYIDAGLDYVIFSMTGSSRAGYQRVYQVDKFEAVLRNLLDFLEERHRSGRKIRVRTVFVDTPSTAHEKEKYKRMLSLIPIDCPSLSPMFNFFGDNKEGAIDLYQKDPKDIPVCKIPWKYFSVTANGDVRACNFDNYDRYLLGNIKDKPLMEYWNCQAMQDFRQALIDKNFRHNEKNGDMCSKCNEMFFNIKKDHICTAQWPYDFREEAEKYFQKGSSHLFEVMPPEEYQRKYQYLQEHKEEWLAAMLANDTSPREAARETV